LKKFNLKMFLSVYISKYQSTISQFLVQQYGT